MPDSWAKAFLPTIALLYCTGKAETARADCHHHLLECGIAGALAKAVDRAFDLAGAAVQSSQRVGDRQPEIVMAMGREDDLVGAGDAIAQHRDQRAELLRRGIADRVRHVDRGGAGADGRLDHPAEEIVLGTGRVHRRPFDVVGEVARPGHRGNDAVIDLVLAELQLELAMQRRGADEGVNPLALGVGEGLGGPIDVGGTGPGEAADNRFLDDLGNLRNRFEIAVRGDRKAGLDDIDAHLVEELGDLHLLLEGHRCAGRLLAIAQRGVEDDDAILAGIL